MQDASRLEPFVDACLRDGVDLIAIHGPGCIEVENLVDEIIVGDGSDPDRFATTAAFPDEPLEDVEALARLWAVDSIAEDRVELVRL